MTSKSVSRNWPPPSYGLTIYQTSVCLSTQIHSSRLPNPCGNSWMPRVYLDASESSKVQKEAQGNSLSPLVPGPIHDYSRHSFVSSPFPPDRQSYLKHPLVFLSSLSFAMTLIASDTGNLSHHLIHFRPQHELLQRIFPERLRGL